MPQMMPLNWLLLYLITLLILIYFMRFIYFFLLK